MRAAPCLSICFFCRHSEHVYRMLYNLSEVQRLAYQQAEHRTLQNVLRLHIAAFLFGRHFCKVFAEPKKLTRRRLFGCPFHSIVTHFAEFYRLVSLRSIMAETSERLFHEVR